MLFEVDPIDVATFASVMIGACAVAVLASLVPGWRASRLNPVAALRRE
jgi:ABC-type lipoprotein release transport system permease subunit